MMRALSLVALFLAGCSNLPDYSETCGNGVIDRGESCDGGDPSLCVKCRLRCPSHTDDDCAKAGPGYRCGADDICHAPSGVFWRDEAPSSFAFPVGQGSVADLDGDRIGDIIGFSDINIDVHWGDLETKLADRTEVVVPFTNTNAAIRTLPGYTTTDGVYVPPISDVLMPTSDGVAAFAARGHQLVAYPFANAPGSRGACATVNGTAEPLAAISIDKHHMGFVSRLKDAPYSVLLTVDQPVTDECTTSPVDVCGLTMPTDPAMTMTSYAGVMTDHYELPPPALSTVVVTSIIAINVLDSTSMMHTCAFRFVHDPSATTHFAFTRLTPNAPNAIATTPGPVTLARAEVGAQCPALFTPSVAGVQGFVATSQPPCGFVNTSSPELTTSGAGLMPSGRIPLVPAIAGVAPDALAVVEQQQFGGTTSIYSLAAPNLPSLMYTSTRPLYPVLSADLDGNGSIEAVGMAPQLPGIGASPDIDVLYRTTTTAPTFISYRISTQNVPNKLALGDFDGNGDQDIAFTERIGAEERLMIAYGTHDRPLDPVEVAAFSNVDALARLDLPDSLEPTGEALDDLIVIDRVVVPPDTRPTQLLTILHGNPQRSMLAYYDPRTFYATAFVAATTGNFDPRDPALDVMMFEQRGSGGKTSCATTVNGAPVGYNTTVWIAAGVAHSEALGDTPKAFLAPQIISGACAPDHLCLEGARLVSWRLADRDVMIAADAAASSPAASRHFYVLDPMMQQDVTCQYEDEPAPMSRPGIVLQESQISVAPQQGAFSMWGADLDGDGRDNLVVVLGSLPQAHLGSFADDQVIDCQVDDTGMPTSCVNITDEVPELAGWTCRAAETAAVTAAGRLDPRPKTNAAAMLVVCKHGTDGMVFRVGRDDADGALHATPVLDGASDFLFSSIGDINGDGVADFAGISFDHITNVPHVSLHPQCAADDLACIDGNPPPALEPSP